MVKWVGFLKRRSGVFVDDFQREWRTTHTEVVRRVPHLRGYVQSHVLVSGYRKGEPAVDGVAELWFDDVDSFQAASSSVEFAAARDDADRLLDRASARGILTEEHLIKPGPVPAGAVKNIELVVRRRDVPPNRFHRYWREHHGPLASQIAPIRRYVQSHAIEDPVTRPLDGIASTWFDDTAAMRESAASEAYRRTREDEDAFVEVPLAFVITREHVVIEPPELS